MGTASKSKETTTLGTQSFGGIFQQKEGLPLAQQLEGLLTTPIESQFGKQLQQELTTPTFAPQTEAGKSLLQQALSGTQGATAARGLGQATQGALASTAAPVLQQLRGQRVASLQQAFGQDIASQLADRGLDIESLVKLSELALPQVLVGQTGQATGAGQALAGGTIQSFTGK